VPANFPCIGGVANGNQQGIGSPAGAKVLVKCAAGLSKASATFVKSRQKALQKCLGTVLPCLQQTPGDACLEKAQKKCAKLARVFDESSSKRPEGKAIAAVEKACNGVGLSDLLDVHGLGVSAVGASCAAIGVPTIGNARELAQCMVRYEKCRVDRAVEKELPRADELFGLAGVAP
jgi:hypothetical protein